MTRNEFRQWLAHHRARFPGLGKWLASIETDHKRDDDAPALDDVMDSWYRTLSRADLDHAKEATDQLGDTEPEPRGWERHPIAVAGICRRLRHGSGGAKEVPPKYVDGEQVYRCKLCRDGGFVTVFSVEAMKAVRSGKSIRSTPYKECATKCTCPSAIGKDRGLAVFDPDRMVVVPWEGLPADGSNPPELVEFMAGRGGRYNEFDTFGD